MMFHVAELHVQSEVCHIMPTNTHESRTMNGGSRSLYSYGGSVLRVNLTDGTIHRHPTEEHLARAFLGGRGLNVKRLWDELPAHTDGLVVVTFN